MENIIKLGNNIINYNGFDMLLTTTYLPTGYRTLEENKYVTIEMDEAMYCIDITRYGIDGVIYRTVTEFINVLYS